MNVELNNAIVKAMFHLRKAQILAPFGLENVPGIRHHLENALFDNVNDGSVFKSDLMEALDKACKLRDMWNHYFKNEEPTNAQLRFCVQEIKEAHKILSWEEFKDSTKA